MARKALTDGEKSKTVAVRLGSTDHARLVAVAEKFGKSTTEFARMVLLAAASGSETHASVAGEGEPPSRPRRGSSVAPSHPEPMQRGHSHVVVEGKSKSPIPKCSCGAFRRADGEWVMP